jgi:hypothetical protein
VSRAPRPTLLEDFFAGTAAVNIGVVEQGDASVESRFKSVDGALFAFGVHVGRVPGSGQAHATERDGELGKFHSFSHKISRNRCREKVYRNSASRNAALSASTNARSSITRVHL